MKKYHPAVGDIKQAEAVAKTSFIFFCQCSTLCPICPNSTAQEAAVNSPGSKESCQATLNQHFPENWTSSGSSTLHRMGTQKETHFFLKECLFSAHGGFIKKKKNQPFPIKTHNCDYGTFAEHQNLCRRYLSRDSNWSFRSPDSAFLFSEELSFTIKIITQ